MILSEIKLIAERVVSELSPYCEKCCIAGSIRRKKADCKDIEVVIIPRTKDLAKLSEVVNQWHKVKGEVTGKYTQRILPSGIKLDLFIANKDNWGLIYAIRTGSADFSFKVLACGWKKKGYTSENGILYKTNDNLKAKLDYANPVYIREEKELFGLIGVEYIEPEFRI
jgi:DNA polymerase/3'-5' exonuclease PolX